MDFTEGLAAELIAFGCWASLLSGPSVRALTNSDQHDQFSTCADPEDSGFSLWVWGLAAFGLLLNILLESIFAYICKLIVVPEKTLTLSCESCFLFLDRFQ